MITALKILTFFALVGFYFLFAGAPALDTLYGRKLAVIYGFGAVMALWFGGEPIGTLDPISLRSIFIALGAILMVMIFILMFETRDTAKQLQEIHGSVPNKSLQATRDDAFSSAIAEDIIGPACLSSGR
jgi:hypothetical protein